MNNGSNAVAGLRRVLVVMSALALVGCAGVSGTRDASGFPVMVPKADFKLTEVFIDWRDNPGFQYSVSQVVPRGTRLSGLSEPVRKQASSDMQALVGLFKDNVKPMVGQALKPRGVAAGQKQTINLTPVAGFHSDAEISITIRAEVFDNETRKRWVFDLKNSSGVLLLGARSYKPGPDVVESYTKQLMETFASAQLTN